MFSSIATLTRLQTRAIALRQYILAGGEGTNLAYSTNGITWTTIAANMFSTRCSTIAYTGSIWVAGGQGSVNTLAYSNNGTIWIGLAKTVFSTACNAIAYNGSMWVAGGQGTNTLAYSNNGTGWIGLGTSIFTAGGTAIAWNGSMWLAAGVGTNILAYSVDGLTWTGLGINIFNVACYGIAWNGTIWVAVGQGINTLVWSIDGFSWYGLGRTTFLTTGYGIAWGQNSWVAVGAGTNTIASSSDGISWSATTTNIVSGRSVAWSGSNWFVAGDSSNIAYSPNGRTWSTAGIPFPNIKALASNFRPVLSAGLVSGTLPTIPYSPDFSSSLIVGGGTGNYNIAFSNNGTAWTGISAGGFTTSCNGIAYNGSSLWVAVGQGTNTISYSTNLYTWTGLGISIFSTSGKAIAWSGSMWVAVGAGTNTIAYSINGITWTGVTNSTRLFTTSGNAVAWNGSLWISSGTGSNISAFSLDGITWTGLGYNVFSVNNNGIAWNGSMWVSAGSSINTLAWSADGTTWFGLGTTIFSTQGNAIAWSGSAWVACGSGTTNTLAYSTSGTIWTGLGKTTFSTSGINIAWNGSMWIAGGQGTNTLAYSTDGISWVGLSTTIFDTIGNGFSAYQYPILLANSTATLPIPIRPAFNSTLVVAGGQNNNYNISFSNNGTVWTGISTGGLTLCNAITYTGSMWMALGTGINTITYSTDLYNWVGLGATIFSTAGYMIAQNGSMYVAVGSGTNTLAYSFNGTSWIGLGTSIFSTQGNTIVWNGTMWIAGGLGGNTLAYSYNGTTWTGYIFPNALTTACYSLAWNGMIWVAAGSGGDTLAWSKNGTLWYRLAATVFSTQANGVAWNGSMWVACGQGTNTIGYSVDGTTWTGIGTGIFSTSGQSILWSTANSMWIAGGKGTNTMAYSANGSTWLGLGTSIFSTTNTFSAYSNTIENSAVYPLSLPASAALFNSSLFLASSDSGSGNCILYSNSPNSTNWTGLGTSMFLNGSCVNIAYNGIPYNELAYSGSMWVAVGSGNNSICYSYNAHVWYGLGSTYLAGAGKTVAWNGSMFVAGGNGANSLIYSTNGQTWNNATSGLFLSCLSVAYGNSMWVAVGSANDTYPNVAAYSTNGITWTGLSGLWGLMSSYSTTIGQIGYARNLSVSWNGTIWVIIGYSAYKTIWSIDGINWYGGHKSIFNYEFKSCIAWNGSMFVGISTGGSGELAYSSAGTTNWVGVSISFGSYNSNCAITWTGSMWILSSSNTTNALFYSISGISWSGIIGTGATRFRFNSFSAYNYPILPANPITITPPAIPYTLNSSTLIVTGYSNNTTPGFTICISNDDGITWTQTTSASLNLDNTNYTRGQIAYNGILYTAGSCYSYNLSHWYKSIGYSNSVQSLYTIWNGSHFISYQGPGINYSTNGITWSLPLNPGGSAAGLIWNGSTWIASTKMNGHYSSTNGITWTYYSKPNNMGYVYAIGGNSTITIFAGLATNYSTPVAFYSTDLNTWTPITVSGFTLSTTTFTFNSNESLPSQYTTITWNGSMFLMTGTGNGRQNMLYSTNGITWSSITLDTGYNILYPTWTGSRWIATYNGGSTNPILGYSTVGTAWTAMTTGLSGKLGGLVYIKQNVPS